MDDGAGGQSGAPDKAMSRRAALVALALLVAVAALALALPAGASITRRARLASDSVSPTRHATFTFTCGWNGLPACPTLPPDPNANWLAIPADTPDAVLATFTQSQTVWQLYVVDHPGDVPRWDFSRPDTPVFERDLHTPGSHPFHDIWVLPFDLPDGTIGFYAVCDINAAHTGIQVDGVFGVDAPRPHGQFVRVTRAQAASRVEALSHVALRSGTQPYLIYAPLDAELVETGKVVWKAGGAPDTPLWLVPGADGKDRILGDDGRVYFPWQIPAVKAS